MQNKPKESATLLGIPCPIEQSPSDYPSVKVPLKYGMRTFFCWKQRTFYLCCHLWVLESQFQRSTMTLTFYSQPKLLYIRNFLTAFRTDGAHSLIMILIPVFSACMVWTLILKSATRTLRCCFLSCNSHHVNSTTQYEILNHRVIRSTSVNILVCRCGHNSSSYTVISIEV